MCSFLSKLEWERKQWQVCLSQWMENDALMDELKFGPDRPGNRSRWARDWPLY